MLPSFTPEAARELARVIIPKLSSAIHQEEGIEYLGTQVDSLREVRISFGRQAICSFAQCLEILGEHPMTEDELSQLATALLIQLQDTVLRTMARSGTLASC